MIASLLRRAILSASEPPEIERFLRHNPSALRVVSRFVAGDTIDDALNASRHLAQLGLQSTLDRLGENVVTMAEAQKAREAYAATLKALARAGMEPNISVKLSMLGLDISDDAAIANMIDVLRVAASVSGFVCIDMESSAYTQRTLDIALHLHRTYPDQVGTVIQAYLHRSPRDLDRLIAQGMRVRLVKGAYAEPADVALQQPARIDAAFVNLMERLFEHGRFPAIATHDPALIRATKGFAIRMGIDPGRWEFQLLYGVRRDAQIDLAREGYHVRVYVPFGTDWYPYFVRRIAERPANALFVIRQLVSG